MKRHGIQLSQRHQYWLYTVTTLLFVSGAIWLLFGWLADRSEKPSDLLDGIKTGSLKLHGAAAMAFLIALGILIPTHIRRAWAARRNRSNGVLFLTVIGLLVFTGYGLYYFGDETWRSAASWLHIIVGLALPVFLVWHIWQGRRSTRH